MSSLSHLSAYASAEREAHPLKTAVLVQNSQRHSSRHQGLLTSCVGLAKRDELFESLKARGELGNGDHEMTTATTPTEGRNKRSRITVLNLRKKTKTNPQYFQQLCAGLRRLKECK